MSEATTREPEAIERDIRRTQDEMSQTVDKIGSQLTGRNILNAFLDKTEGGEIDTRALLDTARRNPMALALIAGGTIWLMSENDAKFPKVSMPKMPSGNPLAKLKGSHSDPDHRDYLSHMNSVEWREGEDPVSYQRRRDAARASYFMVERGHDEDDAGFRQRLDEATHKFRDGLSAKRRAFREQRHDMTAAIGESSSKAFRTTQETLIGNPLLGGLAAAAVGAILGTFVPLTETEEQKLGSLGGQARDLANEQTSKLTDTLREKKDQAIGKIEEAAQSAGQSSSGQSSGSTSSDPGGTSVDQSGPAMRFAVADNPEQPTLQDDGTRAAGGSATSGQTSGGSSIGNPPARTLV